MAESMHCVGEHGHGIDCVFASCCDDLDMVVE